LFKFGYLSEKPNITEPVIMDIKRGCSYQGQVDLTKGLF